MSADRMAEPMTRRRALVLLAVTAVGVAGCSAGGGTVVEPMITAVPPSTQAIESYWVEPGGRILVLATMGGLGDRITVHCTEGEDQVTVWATVTSPPGSGARPAIGLRLYDRVTLGRALGPRPVVTLNGARVRGGSGAPPPGRAPAAPDDLGSPVPTSPT
ncbi:hypothetical protein [Luteipulveratus flavus]|uniref:Lipoprotein n=1 Tax=Luteipulveratus flavus TaxID=3031728 RepID=A0ABT6CAK7_9MICO|nr:hypothetical protein [Luteipulveratus sp. YIM 133296]MDF8265920.1 hypothetical protein [Luteipulveratus sp. YIM 133296]